MIIGWMIVVLLGLIVLGAPIFLAMATAGFLHYVDLGRESALVILIQQLYGGTRSFTFLAIPMFLLAGNLMTYGGLTDRLIALARALIGHVRGGLGQVNVLSSVFFGAISGSAHADVAAMGSIFIPAMKKEGYPAGFAAALTAVSGTLAPMIPPSIILIVYGATFGVSIGALFAAGLSVALVIAFLYSLMAYALSVDPGHGATVQPRSAGEVRAAVGAVAEKQAAPPVRAGLQRSLIYALIACYIRRDVDFRRRGHPDGFFFAFHHNEREPASALRRGWCQRRSTGGAAGRWRALG